MVSNESSVNYDELGDVITAVDAWLEDETGSTATLCVQTRVWSTADGVTGWGIAGQSGYEGNSNVESGEIVTGVINYDDVVVDITSKWPVNKTHDGWTATCTAKSWGEVVEDREAYPLENEVSCSIDIPATTSYIVSYDANDGTGAPDSQTKWHDEALVLSDTVPERTGYTFKGWGISEDATDISYAAGASYTENSEIALYAVWESNTYIVRYNANGGIGAPENQTKVHDEVLVLSDVEPTRTGYTFKGWGISEDATDATYAPGANYTENSEIILYAVWEPHTYIVSYDANDGTGAPEDQAKLHDKALVLSDTVPIRTGYTFKGWGLSADATDATYAPGASYTENNEITLYAVWEPYTYAVRYNANGGIRAPENQTKVYDVTLVLSDVEPTRTGYIFKGWATSEDGEAVYQPGDSYTEEAEITLYAVWEIIKYTITYNANRGYDAPETQIKKYGQMITISDVIPLRCGYKFLGWSDSIDGDVYCQGGDYYSDNADIVLYAVWEAIPIMKMLNGYEIYDDAAREQITGVVTTGDGEAYNATVKGVVSLEVGTKFTMIPHVVSTTVSPTLNVNGFGAKDIRQRISSVSSSTTVGSSDNWLAANKPVLVMYDGESWVVDFTMPDAGNLYGTVPINSGGTGAVTASAALNNLGITWGTEEAPATGTPNTIYIQIN